MWEGIKVLQDGFLVSGYSEFEDAKHAVTIDDGGVVNLFSNTFDRNHIGIRNGDSSPDYSGPVFYNFTTNTFTCTSTLNETDLSSITYAGIYLDKTVASIGSLHQPNFFSHILNGIVMEESSVYLTNMHLEDMLELNSEHGHGFDSKQGSLIIDAQYAEWTWAGRSSFDNCRSVALNHEGTNLDITGIQVSGHMIGGLETRLNKEGQAVRIKHSLFELDEEETIGGVIIQRGVGSGGTTRYELSYDSLTINNSSGAAFGVSVFSEYPSFDETLVKYNYFEDNKNDFLTQLQIAAELNDRFNIRNNSLQSTSSQFHEQHYGIALVGLRGVGHKISGNNITGVGSHQPFQCAIHCEDSQHAQFCDNHMTLSKRGVHLVGNNAPLHLKDTRFGTHERGLFMGVSTNSTLAINGLQVRRNNIWSSNQSDYSVLAAELSDGQEPSINRIIVQSTNSSILPPKRSPFLLGTWFVHEEGVLDTCLPEIADINPQLSISDSLIIDDELFTAEFPEAEKWNMQKDLMLKLHRFPGMRPNASDADDYFDRSESTSFGLHAAAEFSFIEAMTLSDSIQGVVDSLYALINEGILILGQLDTVQGWQYDTTSFDTDRVDTTLFWVDSIRTLLEPYDETLDSIASNQAAALTTTLSIISGLPDTALYEEANITILLARVTNAADDTLSSQLIADLKDLEKEDHGTHGRAVTKAAILLFPCNEGAISSEYIEDAEGLVSEIPDQGNSGLNMQILNNPSSGRLSARWNQIVSGEIYIYDLHGKTVSRIDVNLTDQVSQELDISSGVYIVRFISKDGSKSISEELIIAQ